jgi:membrane-associated phospholipid phosphatase
MKPGLRLRFFSVLKLLLPVLTLAGMLLITPNPLSAADSTYVSSYLLSYPATALKATTAPLNWTEKDWHTAAGLVFIGTGLYIFDEELRDLVQRNRSSFTDDLATAANHFGEGKYMLPALGLTCLGGYVFDSPQTMDTALLSLKSLLLANGVSLSLKLLTQRERPFAEKGKEFFNNSGFREKDKSFPSGHTTIVWSVAPILAEQYKDCKWVAPTAYTIAALTSCARINNDRHWASDVFAGATIGYLTSQLVLKSTPRLQILPASSPAGISFLYSF